MKSMPLIEEKDAAGNNIGRGVSYMIQQGKTGKFLSHTSLYLDGTVNF